MINVDMNYILMFIFIFFSTFSYAQIDIEEDEYEKIMIIEGGYNLVSPLGNFDRKSNNNYSGFNTSFFFQLKPEHSYAVGLSTFYQHMGAYNVNFIENIDGFGIEVNERTSSHMLGIMAAIRYFPDFNILGAIPFAQISLGPKILFTTTTIKDTEGGNDINELDVNESDASFTYGISGGIKLPVSDHLFINFATGYLPGSSATFLIKKDDDNIDNPDFAIDAFEKVNSVTNILSFSIGLSFIF